ncbi:MULTISPECIES: hypothetical protein [unclassified Flavobacterium]|uniref:hypothetical protein n=1 Tax=unclassified Flavobacterium TaxID=196869 RepID=UPI0005802EB6|nr:MULTISPECIES: hypothetical protein [unclassified Flavobacterium]KIA95599.1 hypothetical protein OA93_17750 [Flavobacterium sp. KMS]OUL62603.1 hypothetical protein B8T70_09145 [Flavobacterium sp. AJR]
MFTNISWGNYIVVVMLLLVSWYLFVGFRFYFDDLKEMISGKRKLQFRRLGDPNYGDFQSELNYQDPPERNLDQSSFGEFDATFQIVDTLVEQLKNFITDARKRKLAKQEVLDYIQLFFKQYPAVKDSAFRSSVSEFIVTECQTLDAMAITQAEVEELWN